MTVDSTTCNLLYSIHSGYRSSRVHASDIHYDVFIKEITTNIKRPPGREKMYDLGAKMGVFLRCNAIKLFAGRTISCSGFRTELDDDYLSNIYRQIICQIVPTIMNYFIIISHQTVCYGS